MGRRFSDESTAVPGVSDRRLRYEAYLTLGVMRLLLLAIPFKRLTASMEVRKPQDRMEVPSIPDGGDRLVRQVRDAIRRAASRTPWESACLVQALTAKRMLQRRGLAGVMFLGADRGAVRKGLRAHAWVQVGEVVVTGAPAHRDFVPLALFFWKGRSDSGEKDYNY